MGQQCTGERINAFLKETAGLIRIEPKLNSVVDCLQGLLGRCTLLRVVVCASAIALDYLQGLV